MEILRDTISASSSVFDFAYLCLTEPDAQTKVARTRQLQQLWNAGELQQQAGHCPVTLSEPGRPERPQLVSPQKVKQRNVNSRDGRAALIHALAHIEFNAINLALDAIWRFRGLPGDYYNDWIKVAAEEAYHFSLLNEHLTELGYAYGDFNAHNGLWEMAEKTAHDPLVRMALVPRVLEARGLDATPFIRSKLTAASEAERALAILDIIERDEIGHVAIGNRWYAWFCDQRGVDPLETFRSLLIEYKAPLKSPFAVESRTVAGFSSAEIRLIEEVAALRAKRLPPSGNN